VKSNTCNNQTCILFRCTENIVCSCIVNNWHDELGNIGWLPKYGHAKTWEPIFFYQNVGNFRMWATPSVPNYKSFQESWSVKSSQNLTKIIERNTKIYDTKYVHYENITNKKSNDI